MSQPSTQDVQKPFDPTNYQTISGAQLAQYVDGIAPFPDKGLAVITTDIAAVAQVPDANATPKWQNYIWVRRQATSVTAYVWNPTSASDAVMLQWQTISLAAVAPGSITNASLAAGSVTNDKIYSVDWSKITSIPTTLLLQGQVAGGALTGTYPNPGLALNAVTASILQSDVSVDANRAVGTNHIQNASVTSAKLDPTVLQAVPPAGSVIMFAGAIAPAGWLECNGSLINRVNYPALFIAIGTHYGVGDGSTTFGLPDMRGYFPRGWDNGAGVDPGRTLGGVSQVDAFKDHTHGPAGQVWQQPGGGGTTTLSGTAGAASKIATIGTVSAPNDGGLETRPKNVTFMFIVKI